MTGRIACNARSRAASNSRISTGFERKLAKVLATICFCLLTPCPTLAEGNAGAKAATKSIDLLEQHKDEYAKPEVPTIIDIGKAQYLTIDGKGAPGGPGFAKSIGAIYSVAFGLKMKNMQTGHDYKVAPLEALWWGTDDANNFLNEPRETWNWKVLIRTPDFITNDQLQEVIATAASRGKDAAETRVRLESITEGRCVQVLHKGPYADEPATIAAMAAFAKEHRLTHNGYHHEIYLTDPNRTAPEKMRTILRQPVKPK